MLHLRRLWWLLPLGLLVSLLPAVVAQAAPPTPSEGNGEVLVQFAPNTTTKTRVGAYQQAQNRSRLKARPVEKRQLWNGTAVVDGAGDPAAVIATLKQRSDVISAEPNRRFRAYATNDPNWASQWNLGPTGINIEAAWPRSVGTGVTVAVVDSGSTAHPDLAGQMVTGYDFISDPILAADGNGRDADPSDPGDYCLADNSPSSWHGTGVAGTVAALRNNGIAIAGVAPGARVQPIRVLGRCGGDESDVIDAVVWAAGGAVAGVPANTTPARVVNLSLGNLNPGACSAAMQTAINAARARGALVVTAAGNSGGPAANYAPGNCQNVLNVGASASTLDRPSYANYGAGIDLVAPGGGGNGAPITLLSVNSTRTNNGSYTVAGEAGTSFAAPQVSAVAALVLAQSPAMTVAQLEARLVGATRALPACAGCGAGIIDANLALSRLTLSALAWPVTPVQGGVRATLTGSGFLGARQVLVGTRPITNLQVVNDTTITGTMPAHDAPGSYAVVVVNPTPIQVGAAIYGDRPRVTQIAAQRRVAGTTIRIMGTNFLPGMTADFDQVAATVTTVESPTSALVVVPAGAAGKRAVVHVTTSQGTSAGARAAIYTWG